MQSFRVADFSSFYKDSIAAYPLQNEKFTQLEQCLAAKQWQKANKATFTILSESCGLTGDRTVKIGNLSCYDLHIIDSLWLKYSHGRFGFSVQQRIWRQVCGEAIEIHDAQNQQWIEFCDRVGWNDQKNKASALTGYFPSCVGAIETQPAAYPKVFTRLYSRLEGCRSSA